VATSQEKLELLIGAKDKASPVLSKLKSAVVGIGAAYLGWQGVTRIIGDIIEKAAESEKVWNDVTASLERHGFAVENNISAIQSFASELQRTTGISDELAGQSVQMLIDANNTLAGSFDIVRTAADFAAAKHIDVKSAVDLLIKASEGYTSTLSRYGIIIDESIPKNQKFAETMRLMNEKFGGAAQAQLNTYAGQVKLLQENFGDLEETIGKILIPTLSKATSELNTFIERLSRDYGGALDNLGIKFVALIEYLKTIFDLELPGTEGAGGPIRKLLEDADKSAVALERWRESVLSSTEGASMSYKNFQAYWDSFFNRTPVTIQENADAIKDALAGIGADIYPTLTSSADNFLSAMMVQNEEAERTRDILIDLAEKGVNYLVTELELTNDQIVQIIQMAEEMGIAFEGAFKLSADASNENLDMFIAFSEGARSAVTNTANMMVGDVGIALHHMADQSRNYFIKMYMHFVSYFAEAVLEYMANNFVRKFLGILNIFDVAANDRMAMQQGRDFAYYFSSGVLSGIREQNLGLAIAGEIGGYASGRSTGAAMSATAIRKTIIPEIQREAQYGITTIMTSGNTLTGGRVGYVS
jgi:hypothetical protein